MAVVLCAMVLGTAGCSARNGLGTSSAVCFRAIPVGKAAVDASKATGETGGSQPPVVPGGSAPPAAPTPVFVGVRSASQKQIDAFGASHNYEKAQLIKRNGGPVKSTCLVAFRGSFEPGSVSDLLGPVPPVGHRTYAVVVVSEPSNKLLATFLRSKEPISFTHYAVGGG
jgi:hypothetical protein